MNFPTSLSSLIKTPDLPFATKTSETTTAATAETTTATTTETTTATAPAGGDTDASTTTPSPVVSESKDTDAKGGGASNDPATSGADGGGGSDSSTTKSGGTSPTAAPQAGGGTGGVELDEDEVIRRATAMAMAVSTSHLSTKEAQMLASDNEQKRILEQHKKQHSNAKRPTMDWPSGMKSFSALTAGAKERWKTMEDKIKADVENFEKKLGYKQEDSKKEGQEEVKTREMSIVLEEDQEEKEVEKEVVAKSNEVDAVGTTGVEEKEKEKTKSPSTDVHKSDNKESSMEFKVAESEPPIQEPKPISKEPSPPPQSQQIQTAPSIPETKTATDSERARRVERKKTPPRQRSRSPLPSLPSKTLPTSMTPTLPNLAKISNSFKMLKTTTPTTDSTIEDNHHKLPPPTISSIVWKRRSGLGKYKSDAWERRRMALCGNTLVYFKEEGEVTTADGTPPTASGEASPGVSSSGSGAEEEHSKEDTTTAAAPTTSSNKSKSLWAHAVSNINSFQETLTSSNSSGTSSNNASASTPSSHSPRGSMDLIKERAHVSPTTGHGGATPTPFSISIKPNIKEGSHVGTWKMCYDSHEEMMRWMQAFIVVIVKHSVGGFDGKGDWKIPDEKKKGVEEGGEEDEAEIEGEEEEEEEEEEEGEKEVDKDGTLETKELKREVVPTPTQKTTSIFNDLSSVFAGQCLTFEEDNLLIFFVAMNATLYLIRQSGWFRYLLIALLINGISYMNLQKRPEEIKQQQRQVEATKRKKRRKPKKKVLVDGKLTPEKPLAGSSTMLIPTDEKPSAHPEKITWQSLVGSELSVRSNNYLSSKLKVPSPGSLYDCFAIDVLQSPERLTSIASKVTIPPEFFPPQTTETPAYTAPDILIISVGIPTTPPSLTKTTTDGPGLNLIFYFNMKPTTRELLLTPDPLSPLQNAVSLFDKWCRESPKDAKTQSRFKLIPASPNMGEVGIPSYISKYNNKPLLIKRKDVTGFFKRADGASVLEFEISFHPFPYIAKQAFSYLNTNYFKLMIMDMGFVIEGRDNEELPEVVVGCGRLCFPDPEKVLTSDEFF